MSAAGFLNDIEQLKGWLKGIFQAAGMTDVDATSKQVMTRHYHLSLSDGGTAGTNADEIAVVMQKKCKVVAVYITTPVAVAGHATANKIFTIAKRTAGGSATTIAALTCTVANAFTAFAPKQVTASNGTFTSANVELAAGDALTAKAIIQSTGIAIASATAAAYVTVVVEEN